MWPWSGFWTPLGLSLFNSEMGANVVGVKVANRTSLYMTVFLEHRKCSINTSCYYLLWLLLSYKVCCLWLRKVIHDAHSPRAPPVPSAKEGTADFRSIFKVCDHVLAGGREWTAASLQSWVPKWGRGWELHVHVPRLWGKALGMKAEPQVSMCTRNRGWGCVWPWTLHGNAASQAHRLSVGWNCSICILNKCPQGVLMYFSLVPSYLGDTAHTQLLRGAHLASSCVLMPSQGCGNFRNTWFLIRALRTLIPSSAKPWPRAQLSLYWVTDWDGGKALILATEPPCTVGPPYLPVSTPVNLTKWTSRIYFWFHLHWPWADSFCYHSLNDVAQQIFTVC
jgi:hypothetical protein